MSSTPPPPQQVPVAPQQARQRPQSAHVRRVGHTAATPTAAAPATPKGNRSPTRGARSPTGMGAAASGGCQKQPGTPSPRRPTSAQARWSEKRPAVKSSSDVIKEVAGKIRESEARVLRARNEHVHVCDRPESGKFNTVFHRKINLDLQIEAHRTLMNTRFSADGERLVEEESPSSDSIALPGGGGGGGSAAPTPPPRYAVAGTPDIAIRDMERILQSSGGPKVGGRPVSARTARTTTSTVRTVLTTAGSGTTRATTGGGMSVVGRGMHPTSSSSASLRQKPSFCTVWHEPRCDDQRVQASHNLSLGIHKEPFVPTPERVQFRCTKQEAEYPFEDARRRADAASTSRPATPRSVMSFFKVEDEEEYGDVDAQHNAEWRSRVLSKIAESGRKNKLSKTNSAGTMANKSSTTLTMTPTKKPVESPRGTSSPRNAAKQQQLHMTGTSVNRAPMVVRGISSPSGKTTSSKRAQHHHQAQREQQNAAHPKDVYAWSAQCVPPVAGLTQTHS